MDDETLTILEFLFQNSNKDNYMNKIILWSLKNDGLASFPCGLPWDEVERKREMSFLALMRNERKYLGFDICIISSKISYVLLIC